MYKIRCLIFFVVLIPAVHCVEIFIRNLHGNTSEPLKALLNKTYELPMFQSHLITTKLYPEHFHHKNNQNIIGFRFEIQSSNLGVVHIQKKVQNTALNNNVLLEDLFILSNKKALGHIFNAYPSPSLIKVSGHHHIDISWSIEARRMDSTNLTVSLDIFYDDDSRVSYSWPLTLLVTQPKRLIDKIFTYMLPFLVVFISIQMGILLETKVLADLFKSPKPIIVGFISQYGLMPFLAMAIAKIFNYTPLYSLALFVIGCCPGSGASNQWTLLFDGDVNLSAVMSFVSTATSFVMMPLYFYTLGRIYTDELSIRVPFLVLVRSLVLVVVPYGLGILISYYSPKTRSTVQKLVKPIMLFFLIFFLFFGTAVNWYLIETIDLYTALTAPLLPYIGFLFGGVIAWVCRCDWIHVKTIAIEAGIQNVGIAFMIIYYSFPQPYATQAIVVPLVVAFLTTKPFWLLYIIRKQVNKYRKTKETKVNNGKLITNEKSDDNNPINVETEFLPIIDPLK